VEIFLFLVTEDALSKGCAAKDPDFIGAPRQYADEDFMFDDAQNGLSSSLSTTRRIYLMDFSQNGHQLANSSFHNTSRTGKAMRKKLSKTFSKKANRHCF